MTETAPSGPTPTESHTVPGRPAQAETVRALRTVLLFTIADPFALVPEEIMWAGYHLDRVLNGISGNATDLVPIAVKHELADGHYTRSLSALERRQTAPADYDPAATHADLSDWVAVLMHTLTQCFTLRPMEESAVHGQLVGLLRELGVGDPRNPRVARYLPNDVRFRLASAPR